MAEAHSGFCPVKADNSKTLRRGRSPSDCLPACLWYKDCPMAPEEQLLGPTRMVLQYVSPRTLPSDKEFWALRELNPKEHGIGDSDRYMAEFDYLYTGNEDVVDGVLLEVPEESQEAPDLLEMVNSEDAEDLRITNPTEMETLMEDPDPLVTRERKYQGGPFHGPLWEKIGPATPERPHGHWRPLPKPVRVKEMQRRCACYVPKQRGAGAGTVKSAILKDYGRVLVLQRTSGHARVKDARNGKTWIVDIKRLS